MSFSACCKLPCSTGPCVLHCYLQCQYGFPFCVFSFASFSISRCVSRQCHPSPFVSSPSQPRCQFTWHICCVSLFLCLYLLLSAFARLGLLFFFSLRGCVFSLLFSSRSAVTSRLSSVQLSSPLPHACLLSFLSLLHSAFSSFVFPCPRASWFRPSFLPSSLITSRLSFCSFLYLCLPVTLTQATLHFCLLFRGALTTPGLGIISA